MKVIQIILTIIVAIAVKIVVGNFVGNKPRYITNHSSSIKEKNVASQSKLEQAQSKSDFVLVTKSSGKYGEFKTFLDKSTINKDGNFYLAMVFHHYTECSDKQLYCSKIEILVFECEKGRYLVGLESVIKNEEIIETTKSASKDWRSFNKSKLYKSISKLVCPVKMNDSGGYKYYLTDEQYKNLRTEPTYHYVPSYRGRTRCADGTYSSSTGRGTCSHHGGIAY